MAWPLTLPMILLARLKVSRIRAAGKQDSTGIGIGIFLIALGAILTFAVDWSVGGLDLHIVGWILMIAGTGGLIMFFTFWNRRREPEAVAAVEQRPVSEQPRTYDRPALPAPATVTTVTPQQPAPA